MGGDICGRNGELMEFPVGWCRDPGSFPGFQAAYNALTAALGALYFRDMGGEGQHIDVSEQEAMAFILNGAFPVYNGEHRIHGKDVAIPASVPSGVLPCRDGYVLISAIEHHQWEGLVKMLGEPEWSREGWADTVEGRRLNYDIINAFMMEWLEDKERRLGGQEMRLSTSDTGQRRSG